MKPKYIIVIVIVIVLLAAGAAVAAEYAKNRKNSAPQVKTTPGTGSGTTSEPVALDYNKTLGIGSRGAEVQELQRLYNASWNSPKLTVDGVFGAKTLSGVIKVMSFGTTSVSLGEFKTAVERPANQAKDANFLKSLFGL